MDENENQACPLRKQGPPDWHYTCPDCGHEFVMPPAKGPTEEKSRTCPKCGGENIKYNAAKTEACAPGG